MALVRALLTLVIVAGATTALATTPPGTAPEVLGSGPWNDTYSAVDTANTHTWVTVRSKDIANLEADQRLRLWLQWAPSLDGPWKTKSKGEIEVRPKQIFDKPQEHPRLRSRAYVQKAVDNDDVATLEMGPLSRPVQNPLPYFRVAQTIREPGEARKRTPRSISKPEDGEAVFSKPFQATLGIILAYRVDPTRRGVALPRFDSVDVLPDQPGPWTNLSFPQTCRTDVSFFIGLGGINHASIVATQPFDVISEAGELEFWSCHNRPKSYRPEQGQVKAPDTQWWGVCPVRVPIPPPGESVDVTVRTTLFNQDYKKTYHVYGLSPTPERMAERKVNETQYRLLQSLLTPTPVSPAKSPKEVALALITAQGAVQSLRELYRTGNPSDYATALTEAYVALLEVQHQDRLLKTRLDEEGRLNTRLACASLALTLQKWEEALAHLDAYYDTVKRNEESGALSADQARHLLVDPLPIRNLEPFSATVETASFVDLMKQWAWTMSDPMVYKHALIVKGPTPTPQEYQELAELVVERAGNRDLGETLWRKSDDLVTSLDSPFHSSKITEKLLKAQRPGWWSDE